MWAVSCAYTSDNPVCVDQRRHRLKGRRRAQRQRTSGRRALSVFVPVTRYAKREGARFLTASGSRPRRADTDSFGKSRLADTWYGDLHGAGRPCVSTLAAQSPDACSYSDHGPGRTLVHPTAVRVGFGRYESDDVVANSCFVRSVRVNPLQLTLAASLIRSHNPGRSSRISVRRTDRHFPIEEASLVQVP